MTSGHVFDTARVLIVGNDEAARSRTLSSLEAQTVAVPVLQAGDSVAASGAGIVILAAAGATLDRTACERLVWYLATHPQVEWVSGGAYGSAGPEHALGGIMHIVAVREARAVTLLGAPVWRRAGHDAVATPGVALQCVMAMQRAGGAGGWLDPLLTSLDEVTPALRADLARAAATLDVLGVSVEQLVDVRATRPSPLPLQHVPTSPLPAMPVRLEPARATRTLVLVQGFPMGGYSAFNADLIPRLVARGHAVTTAALEWWRSDWRLDQVRRVAPDIHHVPSAVPFAHIPSYLEHLIRSREIEVVLLSHAFLGYRLLMHLRATFPQVAFVDYVHTEWYEAGMYGSYATMSAAWSSQLDAQIVSSGALGQSLVREGAHPDRVHVAYIGIDTTQWKRAGIDRDEIRSAFGASADSVVLLFAGRVSPEKRPLLALDALERLRAEGRDVRLVVAGDGPVLRALHEEVAIRQLDEWVSLLGEVDEHTLRQVYSAADIYFAPSEIEGIARTLYEAMAMECVPVVSDVGGQRELVEPAFGAVVTPGPGTIDGYLPALRRWCAPDRRAAAGVAARAAIVAKFDSQQTLASIEGAITAARTRRAHSSIPADSAMAREFAVLGLEVARRHAAAMAAALDSRR